MGNGYELIDPTSKIQNLTAYISQLLVFYQYFYFISLHIYQSISKV